MNTTVITGIIPRQEADLMQRPCQPHPLFKVTPCNGLRIELAYATDGNVLGHKLYDGPSDEAWLAPEACAGLEKAACLAASYDLCLVLLDAYRPAHAQKTLWERFLDERFVAKPVEENGIILSGSAHTRGIAVDCALASADPASGLPKFLPMPSSYDDFSPAAMLVNAKGQALANAKTLKTIMRSAGFEANPNEWWHFELPGAEAYPFIPYNELQQKYGS